MKNHLFFSIVLIFYKLSLFSLNIESFFQKKENYPTRETNAISILQELSFKKKLSVPFPKISEKRANEDKDFFYNFHEWFEIMKKTTWDDNKNDILEGFDIADKIILSKKYSQFVSLGQGPAWIVKMAEILSQVRGEKRNFQYLCFSSTDGPWEIFRKEKNDALDEYAVYKKYDSISPKQVDNYKKYLKDIEMDPDSIIRRFEKDNEKTLLFEYIILGRSLAFFLYILCGWAKNENKLERLKRSLDICVFRSGKFLFCHKKILLRDEYNESIEMDITVYPHEYQKCKNPHDTHWGYRHKIPYNLFDKISLERDDDLGEFSSRLVPRYQPNSWSEPPKNTLGNEAFLDYLCQKIKKVAIEKVLLENTTLKDNFTKNSLNTAQNSSESSA